MKAKPQFIRNLYSNKHFSWMGAKLLKKVKRPGKKIQKSCVEEEFSHSGKKKKKVKTPEIHAAF